MVVSLYHDFWKEHLLFQISMIFEILMQKVSLFKKRIALLQKRSLRTKKTNKESLILAQDER